MLAILLMQPMFTLLIEVIITIVLALILGFIVGKFQGMGSVGLTTLILNLLILLLIAMPISKNRLPLHHIALSVGQFSPDAATHLVNTYLVLEIAIWTNLFAATVGYYFSEGHGAFFLAFGATLAAVLCTVVAAVPFYPFGFRDTTWILAIGLAIVGIGVAWLFNHSVLDDANLWSLIVLWAEYVLACWIGYQVAGRAGLLLITLPSQLLLGLMLYFISGYILPIEAPPQKDAQQTQEEQKRQQDQYRAKQKKQRAQTLRSLISYNLGTNYPYYVIEDWRTRETLGQQQPQPRVPGNAGRDYFCGPGIIMNSCDHATVSATGKEFTVQPPGISFTGQHQKLYTDIDLRPQVRGTMVQAETKDGITVDVFAAMPHKMAVDDDALPVAIGRAYPCGEAAILTIVRHNTVVEHDWSKTNGLASENTREIPWHELVYLKGPAILKDIIATYTCDELHDAVDATGNFRDPRVEIAQKFKDALSKAMQPVGIALIGAGIGNIGVPAEVTTQRITNWKSKWQRKIAEEVERTETKLRKQRSQIQNEVRRDFVERLSAILQNADPGYIKDEAIFLELLQAMGVQTPSEPLTSNALLDIFITEARI